MKSKSGGVETQLAILFQNQRAGTGRGTLPEGKIILLFKSVIDIETEFIHSVSMNGKMRILRRLRSGENGEER